MPPPLTIPAVCENLTRSDPERAAILAPGRQPLTRWRLWRMVCEFSDWLRQHGVRHDDRVAVVLPGGPELAVAYLGVASTATFAPLNPAYTASEFEFYIEDLRPRALIVEENSNSVALKAAERFGVSVLRVRALPDEPAGVIGLDGVGPAGGETVEPPGPDTIAVMLHTSGTTSRPKAVPLTHRNLCRSAQNACHSLQLSSEDRSLVVMPLFHIHGLVSATLAPLASGGSLVVPPAFYATEYLHWLQEFRPTWYTCSPTIHQSMLTRVKRDPEGIREHSLRFLRTGSAAISPRLHRELEKTFGVPVVEFLGMTEAAQQITSNDVPPGKRKIGSVGKPAGPEVAIMDPDGNLLSPGEEGEVVIRGENVTPGYADNPEANAKAFSNGWFRTGDQGRFDAEGFLYLSGRLKEMINRGGEKVWPREVDEVLLEHPAVYQAVTFAIPHAQLGEEVGAAVVPRDSVSVTESEIRQHVASRLASFKVPRVVVVLDEIPKGPTGKLQRIGLAKTLGIGEIDDSRQDRSVPYAAPRSAVETQLCELWQHVLQVNPVGIHSSFLSLGGDSVLAARLVAECTRKFEVELPIRILFDHGTVAAMATEIERARN